MQENVATGIPTIEIEKAPQREETVTAREASEESNALPGQENDVALEDLEQTGQPKPCRLRAISRHVLVATQSHVPEWNRQQVRTMHRMHEGQGIDHNAEAVLTRKNRDRNVTHVFSTFIFITIEQISV